jgi:hypothetical protein
MSRLKKIAERNSKEELEQAMDLLDGVDSYISGLSPKLINLQYKLDDIGYLEKYNEVFNLLGKSFQTIQSSIRKLNKDIQADYDKL